MTHHDATAKMFDALAAQEEYAAEQSNGTFARLFHEELARRYRETAASARRMADDTRRLRAS